MHHWNDEYLPQYISFLGSVSAIAEAASDFSELWQLTYRELDDNSVCPRFKVLGGVN